MPRGRATERCSIKCTNRHCRTWFSRNRATSGNLRKKHIRVKYLITLSTALTVLLVGLIGEHELWAQAAPPPIIVPQVTPQFNNPGPQVKIPQPGNPLQQRTIGTGSQIVPGRSVESLRRHGHHAAKHRHLSRNHPRTKQHNQGASSQEPSDKQQRPKTSRASQEQEHTPADEKLKQLDDALGKKLKGICRGC